jgi:hypothetical protein
VRKIKFGDTSKFIAPDFHEFCKSRPDVNNIASYAFLAIIGYSLTVGEHFNIDLDVVAYVLVARVSKVTKTTRFDCFEGLS